MLEELERQFAELLEGRDVLVSSADEKKITVLALRGGLSVREAAIQLPSGSFVVSGFMFFVDDAPDWILQVSDDAEYDSPMWYSGHWQTVRD